LAADFLAAADVPGAVAELAASLAGAFVAAATDGGSGVFSGSESLSTEGRASASEGSSGGAADGRAGGASVFATRAKLSCI